MKKAGSDSLPPGPRLPALVQGFRYGRDPVGFLIRLQRRYGDVFTVRFPPGRMVFIADPALAKEVFTGDPALFHAGEASAPLVEPSLGSSSLITFDEDEHMRRRKLLLPPFHGESVRRYGELIREITERDIETWPLQVPFAIRPHTQRVALGVILRAVLGVLDEERIDRGSIVITEFVRHLTLVPQVSWLRPNIGRFGPGPRFERARAALDGFIYEEIAARRVDADGGERDDVFSLLLRATHDDGSAMSDEELRNELVTMLMAGHETTATAIAWALERLLRTPLALDRLRVSLEAGEDDYLDAAIKETLRARPVFVSVGRKLTAPAEIGGYELPAGLIVLPAIAALHYRPDLYPEPHEFRPERFLGGINDSYAWIPFGGGVRRCLGAAFAQFETRVVLKTILERTELRAPDPRPERLKFLPNLTVVPGRDGRVVLERRLQPAPERGTPTAETGASTAEARQPA
jgi:cytochrome P450